MSGSEFTHTPGVNLRNLGTPETAKLLQLDPVLCVCKKQFGRASVNSKEFKISDAMGPKQGQPSQWDKWYYNQYPSQNSQSNYNSQGNSYNPEDKMPGTDMTQGEWDKLRELMRKAESAGKVNELLTVHRKEVKNAPMNQNWGPAVDDDWQECDEGGHASQQPVQPPPGNLSGPLPGYASSPAYANQQHPAFKSPPDVPPININSVQAGKGSGKGYKSGSGYGYQTAPYDPNDDPWVEGKEQIEEVRGNASTRPVLEIFGKVDQSQSTSQKAADAAMQRAAENSAAAAGFPKGPPVVHGQDLGRNSQNPVAVMAAQAEQAAQSAQGSGPNNSAAALGSEKAVRDVSNQQNASKGAGKNSSGQASKHARISEEPVEVHEVGNSNKIPDTGAMTDGSKRRHEAVEETGTEEVETDDDFSYISESGNSPPIFPIFPSGLPQTFRWSDDWKTINIDYEGGDFSIPKPAWIADSYHWSCTKLCMGRFKDKPMSYHDFVHSVFHKDADNCRYAKKIIGQFRKKITSTPRTQGPDLAAFLLHMRVDAFLNAGYVFEREFEWR